MDQPPPRWVHLPQLCCDQGNAQPEGETHKYLPSARGLLVWSWVGHSFRVDSSRGKPNRSPSCISLLAVFTFPLPLTLWVFVGHRCSPFPFWVVRAQLFRDPGKQGLIVGVGRLRPARISCSSLREISVILTNWERGASLSTGRTFVCHSSRFGSGYSV